MAPAYFVEGFGGGSKANGETTKSARAIELVAASNEGVAVLQAMAQMKPARRKFMVTLARALRDIGVNNQSGAGQGRVTALPAGDACRFS